MQPMTNSLGSLRDIIEHKLCHRCGTCAGICPEGVIDLDSDYYPNWEGRKRRCSDCGLCVSVCPGVSFSFPEHSRSIFGRETTIDDEHGFFIKAFLGFSTDQSIRKYSASGGLGTQLPLYLMERGRARCAITTVSDQDHPWKPKTVVAGSREELLTAMGSKYTVSSTNQLFRKIENDPGPFVFTGLPCQVHGLRKAEAVNRALGEKVIIAIGIFCHCIMDHQAMREVLKKYRIAENDIESVEYRFGKLLSNIRVLTKTGNRVYIPYPHLSPDRYRPNYKECLNLFFKFYSPERCRLCIDGTSEFADISIGDPWIKGWQAVKKLREGYNLILARTEKGLKLLEEAQEAGAVVLEPLKREDALASHMTMIPGKRLRAFYGIEKRKKKGRPVPDYGFEKQFTAGERVHAAINRATYFAADRPRLRRALFRTLLSRPGRLFIGALFFRRRVLQALWEKIKKLRHW